MAFDHALTCDPSTKVVAWTPGIPTDTVRMLVCNRTTKTFSWILPSTYNVATQAFLQADSVTNAIAWS